MNELGSILYRIYYELLNRSGLKKYIESFVLPDISLIQRVNLSDWRKREKRPFFLPQSDEDKYAFRKLLTDESRNKILKQAENAIKGRIICFSLWEGDYGNPIDWHKNPKKGYSWPKDVHWSKIMKYEKSCGDIKLTWEINRFPHIYTLIRAYFLTEDTKLVHVFCDQLKSWEEQNPYRLGINWISGQELAIRTLSWITALYAFGDDKAFKEEDFFRLQNLLYLHAYHINNNINFARYAVPNNHLIGEALSLYAIGSLFPWFDKAEKWKNKGRKLLEGECLKQFYEDGGYCQSSHNYHRLALHYYTWAIRIGESLGEPFPAKIYKVLAKSSEYLASFMNIEDGKLPSWGANDGALLNPWTSCDYSNFRPLLTAIRYLIIKKKAFCVGPWDEELFWFFGREALDSNVDPYKISSKSFLLSGLHILRENSETYSVLRCGSLIQRFGHADQLHVDIWWKGLNIAQDGGSYLYNDELEYHKYFMGSKSHNTVTVDEKNQMVLIGRFKWIFKTKAKLIRFSNGPNPRIYGEHYGYLSIKGKIIHRRKLFHIGNGIFIVLDNLLSKRKHNHIYELHWLMLNATHKMCSNCEESKKLILKIPKIGDYAVILGCYGKEGELFKSAEFNIHRSKAGSNPDGWVSRYYGVKSKALSLRLSAKSSLDIGFYSCFFPAHKNVQVYLQEGKLRVHDSINEYYFVLWDKE